MSGKISTGDLFRVLHFIRIHQALGMSAVMGAAFGYIFSYFTLGSLNGNSLSFAEYIEDDWGNFPLVWSAFGALAGGSSVVVKFLTAPRQ